MKFAAIALSVLMASVGVSARLYAAPLDNDFTVQGLELLQGVYGTAYPGYGALGSNVNPMTSQFGMSNVGIPSGAGIGNLQQFGGLQQQQFGGVGEDIGMMGGQGPMLEEQSVPANWQQQSMPSQFLQQQQQQLPVGEMMQNVNMLSQQQMPIMGSVPQGYAQLAYGGQALGGFGGVSSFGAGGSNKKGSTTVAQPIYAQSMIVPKVIRQPILRPHMITQPILQQRLINQPIVETRRVLQPIIRNIVTQPIIQPEIQETTTIQPTLSTQTVVQPHLIEQTIVTPYVQNQMQEAQPITSKATQNVQQAVVQAPIESKKQQKGLGNLGNY